MTLALSKFTIGNQVCVAPRLRNTRVAIVTYDAQATTIASFTDITGLSDVSRVLNSLTASSTQEADLHG